MNSRIRFAIAAAAAVTGFTFVQAGSASAAHCTGPVSAAPMPGFSYFGSVHVAQGEAHDAEGGNPGPHMGASGASGCVESTGSPSERAPGQNKP